ncbi:hypothetical protein D9613_011225 [Agrocybe pediades]|uniref:C2H2-type domain-containing protein n=1 Tax=Agrocybe pediades TaxID=84607 RepID=A0A8H4QRX9_9AGAR|nr:hypothetical protein D9613_011225 [Agrocybe pediades]
MSISNFTFDSFLSENHLLYLDPDTIHSHHAVHSEFNTSKSADSRSAWLQFINPRMLTPEDDFNKDSSPQDLGDVQQSYLHTKPSRRPHAVLRPTTRLISTSPSYVPDISGGEDAEAKDGASQTRRTQQQIEGKKKRKHVDEDEYSYSSPPHPRPPRKRRLHDSEGGASSKQGAKGKDKRSSAATGGTSTPNQKAQCSKPPRNVQSEGVVRNIIVAAVKDKDFNLVKNFGGVCPECHFNMKKLHDLKRHLKTHVKDVCQIWCDLCTESYSRKDVWVRHWKKKHPGISMPSLP